MAPSALHCPRPNCEFHFYFYVLFFISISHMRRKKRNIGLFEYGSFFMI